MNVEWAPGFDGLDRVLHHGAVVHLPRSLHLAVATLTMTLAAACGADEPAPDEDGGDDAADGAATEGGDDDGEGTEGEPAAVTYWRDVKPLLDAHCGTCHVDGGVTPFAIQTYEDTTAIAPAGLAAMHAGTMPPWKPSSDCNSYVAERTMGEDVIEIVDAWVADGMPEGDPADEPPPLEREVQSLSRVDLTLEMPEAYAPVNAPDDYRCFVLPWPEEYDETVYVTGKAVVPGNTAMVHHVIAYIAPPDAAAEYTALDEAEPGPGYTCFGGTNGSIVGSVGGWTPGSFGADTPEGTGFPIEPGSMIVLQMHYNTLGGSDDPDRSALQLKIDTEVERPAFMMPVVNPGWLSDGGMPIPAGEPDVVHKASFNPLLFTEADELTIHTAMLHMHLLGTQGRMTVEHADGTEECILQVDDWDFEWQDFYQLREPLTWKSGDTFGIECHYDNTAENQPLVDGERQEPRDAQWGEGTTDEMCIGFMMVTP